MTSSDEAPSADGDSGRTTELTEGVRRGGDILNPALAAPAEPGPLDAPVGADLGPADSVAPSHPASPSGDPIGSGESE
jgi:hypothetical protein